MSYDGKMYRRGEHAAERLRERVRGEVLFDDGARALYATDGSNYRYPPIGVVVPETIDDVVNTVAVCHEYGLPVLSRGAGTSLAGQCCNIAVVIDMSKYLNKIVSIDPERKTAVVQPGVVLDDLRDEAEKHHLTFAPDPSTHSHNTLGGMLGNNSCGVHSVMGGRTADNVIELDVLTYDGHRMTVGQTSDDEFERIVAEGGRRAEIYKELQQLREDYGKVIRERTPDIPRRVSGFNLDELLEENGFQVARSLVGSEGTCVIVLQAKLRLVYSPPRRVLLVLGYPDVYRAADHVPEIMKLKPTGLEGIDEGLVEDMRRSELHRKDLSLLPHGKGWLLVEFGGRDTDEAAGKAEDALKRLQKSGDLEGAVFNDPAKVEKIWAIRKSGLGATSHVPGRNPTWPGWEDAAVPPERLGSYLRKFQQLLDRYGYRGDLYGHFGDGCIHVRIDFDLDSNEGIEHYRSFVEDAARLVVEHNGSLSGEHGDGQSRGELLEIMYGKEMLEAFRRFKSLWDPGWKMNPGKVVTPYPLDSNLRIRGMTGDGKAVKTQFLYPSDRGRFNMALLRCVGVGACRKTGKGTMCPSYMVTRDEKHSTRGRAHLLFEMLKGDTIIDGWRSESVKEALDLCLSCKACKSECPVNVDVATYKAEFLYHYYKHKRRPLNAYLFGYIDRLSGWGAKVPALANFAMQNRLVSPLTKKVAGVAPERELPTISSPTFVNWFNHREIRHAGSTEVILWPDTFNNYFSPQVAKAAVEVLETLGYSVNLPAEQICCGRPRYEYGFLDDARHSLQRIMRVLREPIEHGVPLIGLEPTCTAVFRDELHELFPEDELANTLGRNTYTLSEFLQRQEQDRRLPTLRRRALAHMHCNHKTILGTQADAALIEAMGLDCDILDAGCCGMAGPFGYHKEKYNVSIGAGERVLLPAVRKAGEETLLIADGFSCREQIRHGTGRRALHLAQVMRMALYD